MSKKHADTVQHFLFEHFPIRGEIAHLDHSFKQIMDQHNYPPIIRRFLGEALVLATLLSTIIKFKGRLSLQFQGKGKFKLLLVQCDNELHIRGLAQWDGEVTEKEVLDSLKNGTLGITIDPEKPGNRYQGIVAWKGESLAESIEGYFQNSEQLPTKIWVHVTDKQAAGFLLQVMPGEANKRYESAFDTGWEHISILTSTLTPHELIMLDNKVLLKRLYVEEDLRLFDPKVVLFQCMCSLQRSENAILLLGRQEIEEELKNKQNIVVKCEFCNKEYVFDKVDVARVLRKGDGFSSSSQVH